MARRTQQGSWVLKASLMWFLDVVSWKTSTLRIILALLYNYKTFQINFTLIYFKRANHVREHFLYSAAINNVESHFHDSAAQRVACTEFLQVLSDEILYIFLKQTSILCVWYVDWCNIDLFACGVKSECFALNVCFIHQDLPPACSLFIKSFCCWSILITCFNIKPWFIAYRNNRLSNCVFLISEIF